MKQKMKWRLAAWLVLTVLLAVGLLPATARAETNSGGKFVLTVEAGGKLLVPPEYISYTEGQTLGEALEESDHQFTFSGSFITAIDGVSDSYSAGDEKGGYDLGAPASQITHLYYYQRTAGKVWPDPELLELMTAMAQYQEKTPDVQNAAKTAYEKARTKFAGIESSNARTLAYDLNMAIRLYETVQNGEHFAVAFSDGTKPYDQENYPGVEITAQNGYGKIWQTGSGSLSLPKDSYRFRIRWNGLEVSFDRNIQADTAIAEALDQSLWLKLEEFALSGTGGGPDNQYSKFTDGEFAVDSTLWQDRTITVPVLDTFSGKVYTYAEYTKDCKSDVTRTLTAIYTRPNEDAPREVPLKFKSEEVGAEYVLAKGGAGNTVVYRIGCKRNDRTYLQDYTVHFIRIPTLTGISVVGSDELGNPVDQAAAETFSPTTKEYTYNVLNTVTSLQITARTLQPDYKVTINGELAAAQTQVQIPEGAQNFAIQVAVSHQDYVNTYTLNIQPGKGYSVAFLSEKEVSLRVINKNGIELPFTNYRDGDDQQRHYYTLVPGEYTYVATYKDYYHISNTIRFTGSTGTLTRISIDRMDDWLEGLSIGAGGQETQYKDKLLPAASFDKAKHFYQVTCWDAENYPYVWLQAADTIKNYPEIAKVELIYTQRAMDRVNHGKECKVSVNPDNFASLGKSLDYFLIDENPVSNSLTIRLSKTINGVLHYQDYVVEVIRALTLANLTARCDGKDMVLQRPEGETGFLPTQMEYDVKVSMAARKLDLTFVRYNGNVGYGEDPSPYRVTVDGVDVTAAGSAAIELDGSINTQVVTIRVENENAPEGTAVYTLNILKSPPVTTSFVYGPQEALLNIREVLSGERLWPDENGNYELCEGYSYDYALTRYGFISKAGTLRVTQNEDNELVILDGDAPIWVTEGENGATATIQWQLQSAPPSSIQDISRPGDWLNFRGNDNNNAVVHNARIPDLADNGTLYWAAQLGKGYDENAVGSPILVGGDIITYSGSTIFRIDTMTGEIKKTGTMDHKSSFSITPPTYWNGMVFVALSDGCVQAFDAETLESLWLYRDPLGGQPNCPITVKDGYLYTGFWKSETAPARFVCLSVTDEDPTEAKESKCASWFYTADGGFYWAGAWVGEEYVLVGTDDGTSLCTSQSSDMLLLDARTGKLLDSWDGLDGDIRCTVVYDEQTGAFYLTSKGGSFYSLRVSRDESTGQWRFADQWSLKLRNGSEDQPPMSTCSPVVYNNRAYVGVSGSSQFGQYSGHNITVIDVNRQEIVYSVPTQGYPQTSGLLTTAYGEDVYVYFFDNYTPGKLRVLRDRVGQTSAELTTVETYRVLGVEYSVDTAYALFTPVGDQAQYAICSPIVDSFGTVYFKNDSACLMAFGSAIDSVEVTVPPQKTTYQIGEAFNPAGMQVTAHYANGISRDITAYVSYSTAPLTAQDTEFTVYFNHVMYQNQEGDMGTMAAGVPMVPASAVIELDIKSDRLGDVDGNGQVEEADARLILDYEAGKQPDTEVVAVVADVSGDGEVNSDDAVLILRYLDGKLQRFPAEEQPPEEETETGSGDSREDPES